MSAFEGTLEDMNASTSPHPMRVLPDLLYTEQGHDLGVCHEARNRNLGTYAEQPRIANAIDRLYDEILGEDQVIWCSPDRPPIIPLEEPRYLHTIRLDPADVLAVLDGFIWEHIIENDQCVAPEVWEQIRLAHPDEEARAEACKQYLARHLPEDLWAHVVLRDEDCLMPVYLLRWPFESEILNVDVI